MLTLASKPVSAALAALFLVTLAVPAARAAVPVEESVEEPVRASERQGLTRQPAVQPLPAGQATNTRRRPNLDIPPTIEPAADPQSNATGGGFAAQPPASDYGGGSATDDTNAAGGLADMFYQLQILQNEIQDLRGQVEEQDHQIKRLQADQKQQYLDLDRRVVALSENRPAPAPGSATGPAAVAEPTVTGGSPGNERDAYRMAFDAMRAQQFDVSMQAFQRLIESYPNGQYTPNAFYWIGEIFLVAQQDAEQARQSFMQVVNLYPDHQKAPDALYKLGVVYSTLGDNDSARRYLQRVQTEYPDTSAAGLAKKYAAELQ